MYQIFLDTDSDFTPELCEKYGAKLISMPYEINGKTIYPYETTPEVDFDEFNNLLLKGIMGTTFAVNVDKYMEYFEPVLKEGKDIVMIHFSCEMSSTFVNYEKAKDILLKKYPERKFYSVDMKAISAGALSIALDALEYAKKGVSAEELIKYVEQEREHFACYYFVDNLKHFARSGRVTGVAAFIGGIIGIRPIISMASDGKMNIVSKAKGRVNALNSLMDYVDKLGDKVTLYPINILYGADPSIANELKDMLIKKYGEDIEISVQHINPTAGVHCGPTVVGISFHSISR